MRRKYKKNIEHLRKPLKISERQIRPNNTFWKNKKLQEKSQAISKQLQKIRENHRRIPERCPKEPKNHRSIPKMVSKPLAIASSHPAHVGDQLTWALVLFFDYPLWVHSARSPALRWRALSRGALFAYCITSRQTAPI